MYIILNNICYTAPIISWALYALDIIIFCAPAPSEKKNCLLGKFYGHYDPALFHARLLHVKERRRAASLIILYTVLMSDGYICRRR